MSRITARLYCHGLGDCLLLKFEGDSSVPYWMLIDCGIHSSTKGGKALVREVVEDILACTRRLDVVVGTHEHWDHNSGFIQAEDLFAQFEVGEVWLAWTENRDDPQGRALDKYKGEALAAIRGAAVALALDETGPVPDKPAAPGASEPRRDPTRSERLGSLLGFAFGAAGELSRTARENLRGLSPTVRFLEPGTLAPLPAKLNDFRVYVLGPSRNPKLFGMVDSATETYAMTPQVSALANGITNGLAIVEGELTPTGDPLAPFDSTVGIRLSELLDGKTEYGRDRRDVRFFADFYARSAPRAASAMDEGAADEDQSWRRIDSDWLAGSSELALQLDNRTNNTSLVLAIEIVSSGKVLLFAADAQIGNWKGWAEHSFAPPGAAPVEVADLLARTVFYKVGHHGSRNATRGPGGLEAMTGSNLTAFVPTDEAMAKKVGWSDIPAEKLLARLRQKTEGRIVQSDADWIQKGAARPTGAGAEWLGNLELEPTTRERKLYVELAFGT